MKTISKKPQIGSANSFSYYLIYSSVHSITRRIISYLIAFIITAGNRNYNTDNNSNFGLSVMLSPSKKNIDTRWSDGEYKKNIRIL